MSARTTRDLCQPCYEEANPTEYFPLANRWGECDQCDDWSMVLRTAIPQPDFPAQCVKGN